MILNLSLIDCFLNRQKQIFEPALDTAGRKTRFYSTIRNPVRFLSVGRVRFMIESRNIGRWLQTYGITTIIYRISS